MGPAHVSSLARRGLSRLARPNSPHTRDASLSTRACQVKPTARQAIPTVPMMRRPHPTVSTILSRCYSASR
jgi:hypothetical protein